MKTEQNKSGDQGNLQYLFGGTLGLLTQPLWARLKKKLFLTQRRKGAKKTLRNAAALCAFAPLREKSSSSGTFRASHAKHAGNLELDDSSTNSNGNRLSAIIGAEFLHNMFEVHFDGFF